MLKFFSDKLMMSENFPQDTIYMLRKYIECLVFVRYYVYKNILALKISQMMVVRKNTVLYIPSNSSSTSLESDLPLFKVRRDLCCAKQQETSTINVYNVSLFLPLTSVHWRTMLHLF